MNEYLPIVGVFVAVLGLMFGFVKWTVSSAEKRDQEQEAHFNALLEKHSEEFKLIHERIDKHVDELSETREQLHGDFVKHADIQLMRKEIREDFNNVFLKMGGISKSLNQLIGAVNGKVKDD